MREYFRITPKRSIQLAISILRMRKIDQNAVPNEPKEIRLFIMVRNESLRLPYLLNYYFGMGADRAFIIDNNSTDDTVDLLLSQKNTHLFRTNQSLVKQLFWWNALLGRYGAGHWCIVVDADELLTYPYRETINLHKLCDFLDRHGYNALNAVALDMYSNKPLRSVSYRPGTDPLSVCPYFDSDLHNSSKYLTKGPWTVENPLITKNFIYIGPERIFGGVRKRIFDIKPLLSTFPLIKYNLKMFLSSGKHYIKGPISIANIRACLLHFKFLNDFAEKVNAAVMHEQYWHCSAEYNMYKKVLDEKPDISFYHPESEKYINSAQLVKLGFMKSSTDLDYFVKNNSDSTYSHNFPLGLGADQK